MQDHASGLILQRQMSAKTISAHVSHLMHEIRRIRSLTAEEEVHYTHELCCIFEAIHREAVIVYPLNPRGDHATAIVEAYLRTVKPGDVLDDPQPPQFRVVGEESAQ